MSFVKDAVSLLLIVCFMVISHDILELLKVISIDNSLHSSQKSSLIVWFVVKVLLYCFVALEARCIGFTSGLLLNLGLKKLELQSY